MPKCSGRSCGKEGTGIGNINITQRAATNGNVPEICPFGQYSQNRPADYWRTLMRPEIRSVSRRPSGYWPQPSKDCLCNISELHFQKTDTPTPYHNVRAIMLPQNFNF